MKELVSLHWSNVVIAYLVTDQHCYVFFYQKLLDLRETSIPIVESMVPRFNPIIAKKGKTRQVLKRPAYLKPKKKANWQRVPDVRDPEAVKQVRGDRDSWKRSLPELLTCSPRALVELLRKDGLLPRLEGSVCPRCQHGTLGKLAPQRQGGPPKHRCNAKNCQAYISPHYAHPWTIGASHILHFQRRQPCCCSC